MQVRLTYYSIVAMLLFIHIFLFSSCVLAKSVTYQLSTHVLDMNKGLPAENVQVKLYQQNKKNSIWHLLAESNTNKEGRIANFLSTKNNNQGTYKLQFYTKSYFNLQEIDSIYPYIEIIFTIKGNDHYHIPITVSANGYTTYKGS